MNTVYLVVESLKISGDRIDDWRDLYAFATAHASKEEAVKELEKRIKEVIEESYEGLDPDDEDYPEIDAIVNEILDDGADDNYHWDATDRIAIWRIIERRV